MHPVPLKFRTNSVDKWGGYVGNGVRFVLTFAWRGARWCGEVAAGKVSVSTAPGVVKC